MTIWFRVYMARVYNLPWLARSAEIRKRYDRRGMRSWDLKAFEKYYTHVERLRGITFNPFVIWRIEECIFERLEGMIGTGARSGLYELLGAERFYLA